MVLVKIQEATKEILISGPCGVKYIQVYKYPQLAFATNGSVLPDDIYYLKQSNKIHMCRVLKGKLIGFRLNKEKPIYLLTGSDRYQPEQISIVRNGEKH